MEFSKLTLIGIDRGLEITTSIFFKQLLFRLIFSCTQLSLPIVLCYISQFPDSRILHLPQEICAISWTFPFCLGLQYNAHKYLECTFGPLRLSFPDDHLVMNAAPVSRAASEKHLGVTTCANLPWSCQIFDLVNGILCLSFSTVFQLLTQTYWKRVFTIYRVPSISGPVYYIPADSILDKICDLHMKAADNFHENSCRPHSSLK